MPDILSHFDPQDNGFGKITKIHKSIRIFNRNFVEKAVKACYDYGTDDSPGGVSPPTRTFCIWRLIH